MLLMPHLKITGALEALVCSYLRLAAVHGFLHPLNLQLP